ncbi:hypothetical protein F7731_19540 [Cytobacillus depressus]|uniref:Type I restriction modification DNA specificity domain-containing protein n=1 Tax=Cytobacillus depressus TaxID=1602942 RepID=A0A6L3V6P4_9BACI|nr:restriction endonuclease subunit S [Cytobacillus depressus]KAB2330793.1 hypothetical protein F7731_19540 [Cytobacillus depressus]
MVGTIGNPVKVSHPIFAIKNVALIKDNADKFNNFLIHFLNSSHIQKQFKLLLAGGTQEFIGLNDIRHLKVLVPCKDEQVQIAQFLSLLDKKIPLQAAKKCLRTTNVHLTKVAPFLLQDWCCYFFQ